MRTGPGFRRGAGFRKIMAEDSYHVEVERWLAERGLSQRKFAKMAGISQRTMNLFGHGHKVSPETRAKIKAVIDAGL